MSSDIYNGFFQAHLLNITWICSVAIAKTSRHLKDKTFAV